MGLSTKQYLMYKVAFLRENSTKPKPFLNLILEMTAHHFCHILFSRSESVSPVHAQGKGNKKGHESGFGDTVIIVEAILSYIFIKIKLFMSHS